MLLEALMMVQFAAIPGTPEPEHGLEPDYSLTWGNDWFHFPGHDMDDFRTNQFIIMHNSENFRYVLDDSMLTTRKSKRRTDEITATVGYDFGIYTIGGGIQSRGNYDGQKLQNWFHRHFNDIPLFFQYEEPTQAGVVYVVTSLPVYELSPKYSLDPILSAKFTTLGERDIDVGELLMFHGLKNACWFGCRMQFRDGADSDNITVSEVQERERGFQFEYGARIRQGFEYSIIFSPKYGTAMGQFTINF